MKKFTFIAATLIVLSGNAVAQQRFQCPSSHAGKVRFMKQLQTTMTPMKVRKAAPALYMPLHEDVFHYENGWEKEGEATYTYDAQGNVLKNNYVTDGNIIRMEYEYNDDNLWTSKAVSEYDKDMNLLYSSRMTQAYDPIVKDLVTESMEYKQTNGQWELVDRGETWRLNITRDGKERVTSTLKENYNRNEFEPEFRTTITYNENGEPGSWKYEETDSYGGNYTWEEVLTLKDMEWYSTDNQIIAEDIEGFFTRGNHLKSARVIDTETGEAGTIEGTYEEDGSFNIKVTYEGTPTVQMICTVTYIDANGSMSEELAFYLDLNGDGVPESLIESMKAIVTCDGNGETLSEELYYNEELEEGNRYDLVYGDYPYPTEWTHSQYDADLQAYVPELKLVRSNFVDVTDPSSISHAPVLSGEGIQEIYNLQGIRLPLQLDKLPAGLYLVKKDGKIQKILKR